MILGENCLQKMIVRYASLFKYCVQIRVPTLGSLKVALASLKSSWDIIDTHHLFHLQECSQGKDLLV
jgi:hypothetical protein